LTGLRCPGVATLVVALGQHSAAEGETSVDTEAKLQALGYGVERKDDGGVIVLWLVDPRGHAIVATRCWRQPEAEVMAEYLEVAERAHPPEGCDFAHKPWECVRCGSTKLLVAAAVPADEGSRVVLCCERCGAVLKGIAPKESPDAVRAWYPSASEARTVAELDAAAGVTP